MKKVVLLLITMFLLALPIAFGDVLELDSTQVMADVYFDDAFGLLTFKKKKRNRSE